MNIRMSANPEQNALFIENQVHVMIDAELTTTATKLSNAEMGYAIHYPVMWLVFYSHIPCQVYWAEYMEINLN